MQQHMLNLATSCHAATHAEPCHIMPYMLLADKQIPLTAIAAAVMGRHDLQITFAAGQCIPGHSKNLTLKYRHENTAMA